MTMDTECLAWFKGTIVENYWGYDGAAEFKKERGVSYNPPKLMDGESVISLDVKKYDREAAMARFNEIAPLRGLRVVHQRVWQTARKWYTVCRTDSSLAATSSPSCEGKPAIGEADRLVGNAPTSPDSGISGGEKR
jgi:hypothetical protein